jgi:hypothetical protein
MSATLRIMSRITAAIVIAIAPLLLVGCASSGSEVVRTSEGKLYLVATWIPEGRPEALISGTLTWSEAGCLAVESGSRTFLLMMPKGTSIVDPGVILDDGSQVEIGDEISWGGGYSSTDGDVDGLMEQGLPRGCITDEVAIVNPMSSP